MEPIEFLVIAGALQAIGLFGYAIYSLLKSL
ncbi:hypothetical protein K30_014 [Salmonella phage Kenya-K30]|nr:hypothetical protein K30_014 [Salmonella phage Kenya-K30]